MMRHILYKKLNYNQQHGQQRCLELILEASILLALVSWVYWSLCRLSLLSEHLFLLVMLGFDELLALRVLDYLNQSDLLAILALLVYLVAFVAFRHPYP